jgi:hypothetical protein
MNSGKRWKHVYAEDGVGDDWFLGKDSELVSLERRGRKEKRKLKHQSNAGKMKRGTGRGRYQKQQGKVKNIGGMRATREQG